jgi:hypothetical protein
MIVFCKDKRRRSLVMGKPGLNGIDYLEIQGDPGCGRKLALTFLKDPSGLGLAPGNVQLNGDPSVRVLDVLAPTPDDPLTVTVVLEEPGDFSPYSLTLVRGLTNPDPPEGVDPQLASVPFSFKAGCEAPGDCVDSECCPTFLEAPPEISYLPKEYEGFRQVILDRLAVLLPDWRERHAADPGITMVEVLAYAADRLSYQQDAVHTEAYLETARSRISLRRHARMVDYRIGEGVNARAWVCVTVGAEVEIGAGTLFYPRVSGVPVVASVLSEYPAELAASGVPAFASMADSKCFPDQNQMEFYTWGDANCCLPKGATEATLSGWIYSLQPGDVLIFEEVLGPLTGDAADADPAKRCAVRLTRVATVDHMGKALRDPFDGSPVTAIAWDVADALPSPLCISSVTDEDHGSQPLPSVTVAHGNVLAVDQGYWVENEAIGTVPDPPAKPVDLNCTAGVISAAVPRFQPQIQLWPLTFCTPYEASLPATSFPIQKLDSAAAQISLIASDGSPWNAARDLLGLDDTVRAFVPEIEDDGSVFLRFGDDVYGMAPETGMSFTAKYRVGNGTQGNIGRDSIAHIVFSGTGVQGVRNPMPAAGGVDPEDMEHIRQFAPFSFERQLRCVTEDDYGAMAESLAGVREARGRLRWTGSWYTAFTSIDAPSGMTSPFEVAVEESLDGYRMIGTDLMVEGAVLVGLRIGLEVCVASNHFVSDVRKAVWRVLVTGDPIRGTLGLLNAANFSFGETVYASPLLAAAQSVDGVRSVRLAKFERMDLPTATAPAQIKMGRLELPRCDNDLDHADRGLLTLTLDGGR